MPPSAVVDASVLVSAFLFPESTPGQVLKLAEKGAFALYFSPVLIEEVRRALRHPKLVEAYGISAEAVEAWCADLHEIGFLWYMPLPETGPVCRDPDDDHVIAAALAAGAGWIVTGDKDLLALGAHQDIRIVTARSFLDGLTG